MDDFWRMRSTITDRLAVGPCQFLMHTLGTDRRAVRWIRVFFVLPCAGNQIVSV